MHWIDWTIVAAFVLVALGIGVFFTRRASHSVTDFFVAGRSLGWFVAGTSMAATYLAADTPLLSAALARDFGIYSHWLVWCWGIGEMAAIFFFARLWRRTEAVTDLQFVALRYREATDRKVLRIFKVFFDGVFRNCITIVFVTFAITKSMTIILDIPEALALYLMLGLAGVALLYSALAGLYGVAYTDLVQWTLAMVGSIALAVIVYADLGQGEGFMARLQAAEGFTADKLAFFPPLDRSDQLFEFLVLVTVVWWGIAPGSVGVVQRLLASRSEKDAAYAILWHTICTYVLRPWPWLLVGIASLVYFPALGHSEDAFPMMIREFLPVGLKGILVAALLAAFMSTIDTHLNYGAAYLVNDFYRPYLNKRATEKHYVLMSRVFMAVITLCAVAAVPFVDSIRSLWHYTTTLLAASGPMLILRWYWWRVNAPAEIASIIASVISSILVTVYLPDLLAGGETVSRYGLRVVVSMIFTTLVWVIVALVTHPEPDEADTAFYRRMRLSGPGWAPVARRTGLAPAELPLRHNFAAWLSCCVFLYGAVFSTGYFLFQQPLNGVLAMIVAVVFFFVFKRQLKRVVLR